MSFPLQTLRASVTRQNDSTLRTMGARQGGKVGWFGIVSPDSLFPSLLIHCNAPPANVYLVVLAQAQAS
jgi:hypothetical protein